MKPRNLDRFFRAFDNSYFKISEYNVQGGRHGDKLGDLLP